MTEKNIPDAWPPTPDTGGGFSHNTNKGGAGKPGKEDVGALFEKLGELLGGIAKSLEKGKKGGKAPDVAAMCVAPDGTILDIPAPIHEKLVRLYSETGDAEKAAAESGLNKFVEDYGKMADTYGPVMDYLKTRLGPGIVKLVNEAVDGATADLDDKARAMLLGGLLSYCSACMAVATKGRGPTQVGGGLQAAMLAFEETQSEIIKIVREDLDERAHFTTEEFLGSDKDKDADA